jgi:lysophospholipase L1-like esterase
MRTLYIIGDSLAQSYQNEPDGQCGWGSYLFGQLTGELPGRVPSPHGEGVLFQGNEVVVANYAKAGQSTRTFLEEKRFDIVKEQLCSGDLLLINFGHNDASFSKQDRYTTLRQFQDALLLFASYAYRKEAKPVFITPFRCCSVKQSTKGR